MYGAFTVVLLWFDRGSSRDGHGHDSRKAKGISCTLSYDGVRDRVRRELFIFVYVQIFKMARYCGHLVTPFQRAWLGETATLSRFSFSGLG